MAGQKTPGGRLTEDGVRAIRALRAETKDSQGTPKYTYAEIAARIGVTLGTVFNVCTRRTWSWLT